MKDKNNNIEVIKNNYYNINDINDINNIEYKINNEEYIKESVYKLLTPSSYLKQPVSQQFAVIRTYARILSTKPSKINPRTTTTSIQQTNPQTIPANQQTNQNSYIDDKKVNLMKKIFDFSDCNRALLDRSLEIIELFAKCEIDLSKFLFYGVNTQKYKDTWGTTLISLLNLETNLDVISETWSYYKKIYFKPKNKNQEIVSFLDFINIYVDYSQLIKNIKNNYSSNIPTKIVDALDNLFNHNNSLNDPKIRQKLNINSTNIATIEDFQIAQSKVDDYIIAKFLYEVLYAHRYISEEEKDIEINKFLKSLFFLGEFDLPQLIERYGNSESLKILQFNNRKNPEMVELIENILVITNFIEEINEGNNFSNMLEKIRFEKNYLDNLRKMISKYQKMMIKLYEIESNYNLTNINATLNTGTVKGKRIGYTVDYSSSKVKVINLTDCKYTLYAHVLSPYETMSELVNGSDDENKVIISLSSISHRNQVYYRNRINNIIFAYDHIPEGNFLLSSDTNIGSNGIIRSNSADLDESITTYQQKGILETSMASHGNNNETVALREGLKPCGIIVPKGVTLSPEIIECSIKYNLPLIITQPPRTNIENPSEIEYQNSTNQPKYNHTDELSMYANEAKNMENPFDKNKSNKIGVLTDVHAMYEPLLAILEDMRKRGITEIYSLGDNIGFGPNPHEVLELLRKYNVKSIYGNHEIYAIDGMDALKEHMNTLSPITVEQDKKRTAWTRNQLTQQDIDDIMKYDSKIVLEKGGKKITLVHSKKEDVYEKNGHFTKPEIDPSSTVIQGHEHFETKDKKDLTLRAAGMGFDYNEYGTAHYLIIDESGNFTTVNVPYNIKNFKESINESSMDTEISSTIDRFVRR